MTENLNTSQETIEPQAPEPAIAPQTDNDPSSQALNQERARRDEAFAAFLQLPDIDPNDDPATLDGQFRQCFVGSYFTTDEMIRVLTGIGLVEDTVHSADDPIVENVVHIDYDRLNEMLEERWEFIWRDTGIYVFER